MTSIRIPESKALRDDVERKRRVVLDMAKGWLITHLFGKVPDQPAEDLRLAGIVHKRNEDDLAAALIALNQMIVECDEMQAKCKPDEPVTDEKASGVLAGIEP